jgi:hypothetical protein
VPEGSRVARRIVYQMAGIVRQLPRSTSISQAKMQWTWNIDKIPSGLIWCQARILVEDDIVRFKNQCSRVD